MKAFRGILFVALIALAAPLSAQTNPVRPAPTVDVEIVWTDVRDGKVDLYTLVTNPNDFDVYLGNCGSSEASYNLSIDFGDGFLCSRREDFSLLPARTKRISQFLLGCKLAPGPNRFHVKISSEIDPHSNLPWNYVVKGDRAFDFVIVNPDTLSR